MTISPRTTTAALLAIAIVVVVVLARRTVVDEASVYLSPPIGPVAGDLVVAATVSTPVGRRALDHLDVPVNTPVNADVEPSASPEAGVASRRIDELLDGLPYTDVSMLHAFCNSLVVDILEAEGAPRIPLAEGAFRPAEYLIEGMSTIVRHNDDGIFVYHAEHSRFVGYARLESHILTRNSEVIPWLVEPIDEWWLEEGVAASLRNLAVEADASK